jgi:imidazolonepropionase-like amidohydrolase
MRVGLVRGIFLGVLTLCSAAAADAATALRFAKMADGSGKSVSDAVIVVDGDKIVSVGSGAGAVPPGIPVIDLRKYTAIPGMIDAHTHISWVWDETPGTTPYRQDTRTIGENVFLAQKNLRRTLEAGVTTVRDLNAQQEGADIALRNLVNRGAMVGPRMFVATHAIGAPPRAVGAVNGPYEMIRAVREVITLGADWIKLFASTGGTQNLTGDETLTFEEIKAAVEIAHPLGKKVAVHSYGPAGAKAAVMAGVDTIEHAIDMDDETLAMMKAKGIYYIPTIDHNRFYADNAIPFEFRKGIGDEYHEFIAKNVETTRRALKAGVKVGMGSDAVYTMAGENTHELGALVKAGMTPAQALAAATTTNAAMLGKEKSLGTIAPGYFADIVAVEGDPLADVNVTINNVRWVMKGGAVVVDKTAAAAK